MFCGDPHPAWQQAATLSARRHVIWVDRPHERVLAVMPAMYDDLWTAREGQTRSTPAVADGGEVVIYAPHVTEVSYVHGKLLDEVGYHRRDYFTRSGSVSNTIQAASWRIRRTCAVLARSTPRAASKHHGSASRWRPGFARALRASQSRLRGSRHRQSRRMDRTPGMARRSGAPERCCIASGNPPTWGDE